MTKKELNNILNEDFTDDEELSFVYIDSSKNINFIKPVEDSQFGLVFVHENIVDDHTDIGHLMVFTEDVQPEEI